MRKATTLSAPQWLAAVSFLALLHSTCAAAPETATWQPAGWGGGGFYFAAIHHPTREGVIYLSGDVNGVYKTEDHGAHWRIINRGLASYAVYSLAVSRSEPEVVFAATEAGLSKSVDGGEHWRTLPHTGPKELRITGERKLSIRAIAVDPRDGRTVYAASPGGKIYQSRDGGETWKVSYEKAAPAEERGALRIQFGKINAEYYGDFALPIAPPRPEPALFGIGFTLRGDGLAPKDCFLMLRTATGQVFRSKNLSSAFQATDWHEVTLRRDDFEIDPAYVKSHPEAAGATFADADWANLTRLDLACSGALPTEAVVGRFTRFYFLTQEGSDQPPVLIRDFQQDPVMQTFGNIRLGPAPSGPVCSVAVAPTDSSHVVAATQDSGLLLSRNAGHTWTRLPTPATAAHATFDPANPRTLFGAFFKNGVMRSDDDGKHWIKISKGIDPNSEILEVAVSPVDSNALWAIGAVGWNGACYRSHDGGASWEKTHKLKTDLAANPTLDSVSGGQASLSAPRNLSLHPRNPKEIFIAANWRPCLSQDGGQTWAERSAGADISCVTDIRFFQGQTYVSAMDEGVLVSEDGGGRWRQLWPLRHTPGLSGHFWRIDIRESGGATRILSTATPWYKVPTGVVRSEDGGKTFEPVQAGLPDSVIRPNTMWGQGHPRALAVDPAHPQTIYLGIDGDPAPGKPGGGVFRSIDGGRIWSQLPNQPASRRMFYGLVVDPTDSARLFWAACGEHGGVYRSTDSGNSWQRVFSGEGFLWNLLATHAGTIYVSGQQLWRSEDHGQTWSQLTRFPEKRDIVGLEVHPQEPKTIWISAVTWKNLPDGAIYRTTDSGTTWQNITGDIPHAKPLVLRYRPDTSELWAGGVGLYKRKQ